MAAKNDLNNFIEKLHATIDSTVTARAMRDLSNEAIRLIVVRTRLGYGVTDHGSKKERLQPLQPTTVALRSKMALHSFTRPKKSNLTMTGQMLNSMTIWRSGSGFAVIGPRGYRDDGLSNEEVANRVSKKRPFNNLSDLEIKKLVRFYRLWFGDLLKKKKMLK